MESIISLEYLKELHHICQYNTLDYNLKVDVNSFTMDKQQSDKNISFIAVKDFLMDHVPCDIYSEAHPVYREMNDIKEIGTLKDLIELIGFVIFEGNFKNNLIDFVKTFNIQDAVKYSTVFATFYVMADYIDVHFLTPEQILVQFTKLKLNETNLTIHHFNFCHMINLPNTIIKASNFQAGKETISYTSIYKAIKEVIGKYNKNGTGNDLDKPKIYQKPNTNVKIGNKNDNQSTNTNVKPETKFDDKDTKSKLLTLMGNVNSNKLQRIAAAHADKNEFAINNFTVLNDYHKLVTAAKTNDANARTNPDKFYDRLQYFDRELSDSAMLISKMTISGRLSQLLQYINNMHILNMGLLTHYFTIDLAVKIRPSTLSTKLVFKEDNKITEIDLFDYLRSLTPDEMLALNQVAALLNYSLCKHPENVNYINTKEDLWYVQIDSNTKMCKIIATQQQKYIDVVFAKIKVRTNDKELNVNTVKEKFEKLLQRQLKCLESVPKADWDKFKTTIDNFIQGKVNKSDMYVGRSTLLSAFIR